MGLLSRAMTGATRAFVNEIVVELDKEVQKATIMQDAALAKTLNVIRGVIERVFLK